MEDEYEGQERISDDLIRERTRQFLAEGDHHLHLVAFDGSAPVGVSHAFRMWPGKDLVPLYYLKELQVRTAHRSKGIGELLIRATAREVLARGSNCLQLSTGRDNVRAVQFYERLNLPIWDKVFYRILAGDSVGGSDLEALAEG